MSTTHRPSRARKPAPLLLNPTAQRLIEEIRAEAREQMLADLSAKDAVIVLHGFDAATKRVRADGCHITVRDAKGNYMALSRHYLEPEPWQGKSHMRGHWHPARWYGRQILVDASGTQWERDFRPFVCNDFGNLVEVPA